jgi:hypothetical protein
VKRIYLAGPVGAKEGRTNRVRGAVFIAEAIAALGLYPFVPHLYHHWDELHAHDYEFWMSHCLEWLTACDALYRMPGHSPGADREVARMTELGRPVFYELDALAVAVNARREVELVAEMEKGK